jgi:hypothetical protein
MNAQDLLDKAVSLRTELVGLCPGATNRYRMALSRRVREATAQYAEAANITNAQAADEVQAGTGR